MVTNGDYMMMTDSDDIYIYGISTKPPSIHRSCTLELDSAFPHRFGG